VAARRQLWVVVLVLVLVAAGRQAVAARMPVGQNVYIRGSLWGIYSTLQPEERGSIIAQSEPSI